MLLKFEDIDNFFVNVLKIKDWKTSFENFDDKPDKEKLALLRKILKAHVNNVYFQNITMTSVPHLERRAPTLLDIMETGSSGIGGVCIQLNYFLRMVLNFLGYDTFTVSGDVPGSDYKGSHCATVVRLNEIELYLVDVGNGLPNYEPVPLHDLPYTEFGGYPFQIRRSPEGVYQRFQLNGSFTKGDFSGGKTEQLRYSFSLEPKRREDFDDNMTRLFTTETTFFLKSAFLFRHFEQKHDDIQSNFILIWGTTVVLGGKRGCTASQYKSYDEIVPVLKEYFPALKDTEVEVALKSFRKFQEIENLRAY